MVEAGFIICYGFLTLFFLILVPIINFHLFSLSKVLSNCFFYVGKVKHSRLKGGAVHHIDYPIFFACLDIKQIENIGWKLWPLFKVNGGWSSFSSLDYKDHLKESKFTNGSLYQNLLKLIEEKSNGTVNFSKPRAFLLTNLTYFGYCFNPISIYYVQKDENSPIDSEVELIVAEVSNTPWIEQHSYVLHESIPNVIVERNHETKEVECVWDKAFHVSPFMEMDYKYKFRFSPVSAIHTVFSQMMKQSTHEIWFTASFQVHQSPFTAINLLKFMITFPIQTRMIQFWIHWEAFLLFFKGVPTFPHPHGTDVDFGFGLTGNRIGTFLWIFISPFYHLYSMFSSRLNGNQKRSKKAEGGGGGGGDDEHRREPMKDKNM